MIILLTLSLLVLPILTEKQLSRDVRPLHYDVAITVNSKDRTLEGTVCIKMICEKESNQIELHGKHNSNIEIKSDLTLVQLSNKGRNSNPVPLYETTVLEDDDLLLIKTVRLVANKMYRLCIPYSGRISEQSDYIIWEGKKMTQGATPENEFAIATNFKKQSAFPCFDDPALKATFKLTLTIRDTEKSFSNTARKARTRVPQNNGWVEETFTETKRLSPSQISFVVTNAELKTSKPVVIFDWIATFMCRPDVCANIGIGGNTPIWAKTEYVPFRNLVTKVMKLYTPEVLFIILPTPNHINSFNWGLVLLREMDMYPTSNNMIHCQLYARLLSQWFGASVSPDSRDSEWLFKALVAYASDMLMRKQYCVETVPSLMWQKLANGIDENIKIGTDPFQLKQVGEEKGLALLRMAHTALGTLSFGTALEDFLTKYQDSSAGPAELWSRFDKYSKGVTLGSKAANPSVLPKSNKWATVMDMWMTQNSYPLITVTQAGRGAFQLSQKRFGYTDMQLNIDTHIQDTSCWLTPIAYSLSNGKTIYDYPKNWMTCPQQSLLVNTKANFNEWVVFGVNYAGLYRVQYDEGTWDLITHQLAEQHTKFEPHVRAQLLSDALALAWFGHTSYDYTFKILRYLSREADGRVWRALFIEAFNLKEMLRIHCPDQFQIFAKYLETQITASYKKTPGFPLIVDSMDYPSRLWIAKTESIFFSWSCLTFQTPDCRNEALRKFDEWTTKTVLELDIDIHKRSVFSTVLCTVLSEIEDHNEQWHNRVEYFYKLLKMETSLLHDHENFREIPLDVLGCIKDRHTITSLLDWITTADDQVTKEEKVRGFVSLARGQQSFPVALEYFYIYVDWIIDFFGSDDLLAAIIQALTSQMNSTQLSKMNDFVNNTPELNNAKVLQAFNDGRDVANLKIRWLEKNEVQIEAALAKLTQDNPVQRVKRVT